MTNVSLGKNAAIRQIMRDRAAKKILPVPIKSPTYPQQVNDDENAAETNVLHDDAHRNNENYDTTLLVLNDGFISRTVTFEDEAVVKESTRSNSDHHYQQQQQQQHHHRTVQSQSIYGNEIYDANCSSDSQDYSSLSSSNWALMQYDVAGYDKTDDLLRHASPWNQQKAEGLVLELLNTPNTILSPLYSESNKPRSRRDVLLPTDDTDHRVYGNDDTGSLYECHTSAAVHEGMSAVDNRLLLAPSYTLSPKQYKTDDLEQLPAAPNGSPFTTFRHNSTSIALEETEVYLRKIRHLEQQLKDKQDQLWKERHERSINISNTGTDENIPPTSNLRTPASNRPYSQSRPRSYSASAATPQTPASTLSSKTTDTLWERNKTLVTEIRFADQTCVELSFQKILLEEQCKELQMKCTNLEVTNRQLLTDIEMSNARNNVAAAPDQQYDKLKMSPSCPDHQMNSIQQEKKDLMEELHESREQIASLRDELIENFESYKDETSTLKIQIDHFVSELNSRLADQDTEHAADQRVDELIKENGKLRQEITNHEICIGNDRDRTVAIVQRAVNTMKVQYETLESTVSRKLGIFDSRFGTLSSTLQYMEDAILQCVDDHSESTVASSSSSSVETDVVVHHSKESAAVKSPGVESETVASGGGDFMNATLTYGRQNQTMDLAMMEEARVRAGFTDDAQRRRHSVTMDLAMMEEARICSDTNTSTIDEIQSPDPDDTATPNKKLQYHFDGLSRVLSERDISFLQSPPTDDEGAGHNGKFLQHLQFLTTIASPIEYPVDHQDIDVEKIDDIELYTSHFHHGLKQIHSNLSYSESENSSIRKEQEPTKLHKVHSRMTPRETTLVSTALPDVSKEKPQVNENISSLLDESLDHISKLHKIGAAHIRGMWYHEESLVMEKLAIEKDLESIETTLVQLNESTKDTTGGMPLGESMADDQVLNRHLDSLQDQRNNLSETLKLKSGELHRATEQIAKLKDEAIKRETLMIRFEKLRQEQEEAGLSLQKKSVFPRKINAETNTLVDELYEQIDMFRTELLISTQKIDTLTHKFDLVEAEKTKRITTLETALKFAVEERDTLLFEIATLIRLKESMQNDKELHQDVISNQSKEIDKLEECVGRLQHRIDETLIDSNELRSKASIYEERYLASLDKLDAIRKERDDFLENAARESEEYEQLEDTKQRLELKLTERQDDIANAELKIATSEAQASKLRSELDSLVKELQKARECNEASTKSLRQETERQVTRDHEMIAQGNQLLIYQQRIESLEIELQYSRSTILSLQCSIDDNAELRRTNHSLEGKCEKLRDYSRTMIKKCRDWETFYDRESKVLSYFHQAYHQSCRKASELSMICQKKDEKVVLLEEARRDLEHEIEDIARELASISQYELELEESELMEQ